MDYPVNHTVLGKKLNTYKSPKGSLKGLSKELILEVLQAWQNWSGTATDLSRSLELSKCQMSALVRQGKKLVKNGAVLESEFKEIKLEERSQEFPTSPGSITMSWEKGRVIGFSTVDQLVDFLRKVG